MVNGKMVIEVVSFVMSIFAFALSIFSVYRSNLYTNIDISNSYRNSLLHWYNRCIGTMEQLHICNNDENQRLRLLSELSALISEGRFFFPNIIKGDFGKEKPVAFRGYRCNILDYVVLYYKIYEKPENIKDEDINYIIRNFTSAFFKFMNPRQFISKLSKSLKASYETKLSYENSDGQVLVLAERYNVSI